MILPLTTLDAVLKVLFRDNSQSEIPEVEFTPFNLAFLRNAPERDQERETAVKGQVVQPKYAQTTA
jgi:hypothetical protein